MIQIIEKLFAKNKKEYVNDELVLDKKVLSKLVGSNVKSFGISTDFATIVCFCTASEKKLIYLKMRKYIKANQEDLITQKLARFYNISM